MLIPLLALLLAPSSQPLVWSVTPERAVGPGVALEGSDALWRSIEQASAGSVIDVAPGRYCFGALGKGGRAPAGTRAEPIVVRAKGEVIVEPPSYGGTATLTVHGGAWVTFEGIRFEAGTVGIFFLPAFETGHVGFRFVDCEIDGLYDWTSAATRHPAGVLSKWGVLSWSLSDFAWEGGSIHDVHYEHAMYHHNPLGDVRVADATLARVGRTALQVRCASEDSGQRDLPIGRGRLVVERCRIADTGLMDGGSALTLAGRNEIETRIAGNTLEWGFDAPLREAWRARRGGQRFGGGALLLWSERPGWNNGPLELVDNTIRYASGCGDRAAVVVGSTPHACIAKNKIAVGDPDTPGSHQAALVISPRRSAAPDESEPGFSDVGRVELEENEINGLVLVRGAAGG